MNLFWSTLFLLVGAFLILLLLKYFLLNLVILTASDSIHSEMINSILRSPAYFFDTTPSGILINKFSNDLGVLDNSLIFSLIDMIEGPILVLIAVANLAQIDIRLLIPSVIIFSVGILFFIYSRPAILTCKELDLQNKNPLFHFFSETLSGLTQIRVYDQRKNRLQQFSSLVNKSARTAISFDVVSRGFAFYESVLMILFVLVGMVLGVSIALEHELGLYGVIVLYLSSTSEYFSWNLRQITVV